MKKAIFGVLLLLATTGRAGAQVDSSCLVYFDSIPDGRWYAGNPDSVLVDTCGFTGVNAGYNWTSARGSMYAKHWLQVTFAYDIFHIPPAPADTTIEVPWQAIDTMYDALRDTFSVLEAKYGPFVFRKNNPAWGDTLDFLNNQFSIRFDSYVNMDSAFQDVFSSVPDISSAGWMDSLIQKLAGVNDAGTENADSIRLYPNPSNSKVHTIANFSAPAFLLDDCGRIVRTWDITPEWIDVSELPSGCYELIAGKSRSRLIITK